MAHRLVDVWLYTARSPDSIHWNSSCFLNFGHFSFIILFVCKQNDKIQSYMIAQIPVTNKKWGFKKGLGLFSVCHICNTACPLLSRSAESFSTCFWKLPANTEIGKQHTKIENFTILSDQKSFEILGHDFLIYIHKSETKAFAIEWNVSEKVFMYKIQKYWILFSNQLSKSDQILFGKVLDIVLSQHELKFGTQVAAWIKAAK